MAKSIHYSISFPSISCHLTEVSVSFEAPSSGPAILTMPSWSPGSYLLREYGRHVQSFSAKSTQGDPLAWSKVSRGSWSIEAPAGSVVEVTYRLFCHDLNVRANHVEDTHAFLNGPSTFMLVEGAAESAHTVTIAPPDSGWRVHTGLTSIPGQRHHFTAESFDELVDCPFLLGPMDATVFEAGGKVQRLVMVGQHNAPIDKLTGDMTKTVEATGDFFGEIPYDDYLTIVLHSESGRGGLEHRNSTVLMFPHFGYSEEESYEDFMSLFSHEHFHAWNVKRIRPAVLGPFDYANENYTRALWIMEGVTCYYENLMLMRAGLMTQARFKELLCKRITALQGVPGRALHSLEDASFDAWIKLYRRDESTPNTTVSYYLKGEVIALALDLTILKSTNGAKSLDDVIHFLWARFKNCGDGFPEDKFQSYVEAIAETDLDAFFSDYVRGVVEVDYDEIFAPFGLTLDEDNSDIEDVWLGAVTSFTGDRIKMSSVLTGSPFSAAGIYAGDELIALGGQKVDRHSFKKAKSRFKPGDTTTAHIFRRGLLLERTVTFETRPNPKHSLKTRDDASADASRLHALWLREA